MEVQQIKDPFEVHGLIHDACHELSIGNFDIANALLAKADKLSHDTPHWVPVSKRAPDHDDWVAARYWEGAEYKYSGLAKTENMIFIGEETMHKEGSSSLIGWEWLDEGSSVAAGMALNADGKLDELI